MIAADRDRSDPIDATYTVIDVPVPEAPAHGASAMSTAGGSHGDSGVHPRSLDTRSARRAYAMGSDRRGSYVDIRV